MMPYYEIMNRLEQINETLNSSLISKLLEDMRDAPKDQTEIYVGC